MSAQPDRDCLYCSRCRVCTLKARCMSQVLLGCTARRQPASVITRCAKFYTFKTMCER